MAKTAIGIGIALILVGVISYAAAEHKSPTAFIPSAVGLLIAVCGGVALNPGARKHAMHAAAAVGLLGLLAAAGRLVPTLLKGALPPPAALFGLVAMIVLTGLFVGLCIRSFVNARQNRARDLPTEPGA